eukprot:349357-Amphidinium_carterae.1
MAPLTTTTTTTSERHIKDDLFVQFGRPSNCVAASSFYSVCCIDECESLLAHIEMRVADPAASPEFIAEIVSNLPLGPQTSK